MTSCAAREGFVSDSDQTTVTQGVRDEGRVVYDLAKLSATRAVERVDMTGAPLEPYFPTEWRESDGVRWRFECELAEPTGHGPRCQRMKLFLCSDAPSAAIFVTELVRAGDPKPFGRREHVLEPSARLAVYALDAEPDKPWPAVAVRLLDASMMALEAEALKHIGAIISLQRAWRARRRVPMLAVGDLASERVPASTYDIKVVLNSGRIDVLQSAEALFKIGEVRRCRIVAVVGRSQVGKTHVINGLFDSRLPCGVCRSTEGLCFLWIESQNLLIADTSPLESTVSYKGGKIHPAADAVISDSLKLNKICELAHKVLFVVDRLTRSDQEHVALANKTFQMPLVLVHNLLSATGVEEAKQLFGRQVLDRYDGEVSDLGELIFTSEPEGSLPQTHHVGICREGTEAGSKFNTLGFEELRRHIRYLSKPPEKMKLTECLEQNVGVLLMSHDPSVAFKYVPRDAAAPANKGYRPTGMFEVVATPAENATFIPEVRVYDVGDRRHIEIDCPAVAPGDIKINGFSGVTKVKLTKRKALWEHEFDYRADGFGECLPDDVPPGGAVNGTLTIALRRLARTHIWPRQPAVV